MNHDNGKGAFFQDQPERQETEQAQINVLGILGSPHYQKQSEYEVINSTSVEDIVPSSRPQDKIRIQMPHREEDHLPVLAPLRRAKSVRIKSVSMQNALVNL